MITLAEQKEYRIDCLIARLDILYDKVHNLYYNPKNIEALPECKRKDDIRRYTVGRLQAMVDNRYDIAKQTDKARIGWASSQGWLKAIYQYQEYICNIQLKRLKANIWRARNIIKWLDGEDPGEMLYNIEAIKTVPIESIMPTPPVVRQHDRSRWHCIYHHEKTPSMILYVKQNVIHCYGCGKDADVIDIYQQLHGCDFRTACENLKHFPTS